MIIAMIMIEFDDDGDDQVFHLRALCHRRMLCDGTPEEKKAWKIFGGKVFGGTIFGGTPVEKSLENIWWESMPAPNLGERHMNNAISSPVLACLTWKHSTTNTKKARDPFGIKNIKNKTNVEMVFSCSLVT